MLEQAAVAKPGQRVVVGEAQQLLLELLARRDVLELGDVVERRPWRSRTSDIERIAETVSPAASK